MAADTGAKPFHGLPPQPVNPFQATREKLEQAEELRRRGNLDRAEVICTGLIRRYPDYVAALHTLGLVYADRKDPIRAVGPLFRAAMLNPKSWRSLVALSGVCLDLEAPRMAADILEQARRLNPREPSVLITLAEIYRDEREYELARDAYRTAIESDPGYEPAQIGLALTCLALGENVEASALLEGVLKRGARSLGVLSALTQLPPSMVTTDLLKELDQVARPADHTPENFQASIAFARAAVLDKLSRYDEAWDHLKVANKIRFGAVQQELRNFRQQEILHLASLKKNAAKIGGLTIPGEPITLLILGPSRSGKTSMEKLIGTISGVKRGYENPSIENAISRTFQEAGLLTSWEVGNLPPQFYPTVRELYREELFSRAGPVKVFTNTNPGHIREVGRLATIIPNLRCVFVKRDVEDITLRIFMRNYLLSNPYAYDLSSIREHIRWYYEMMDLAAQQMPDLVKVINYEEMVADPRGACRAVSDLCGILPPDGPMLDLGDDRGCAAPYREKLTCD